MDAWLQFARGPLFALCFLIMIMGLARLALIQIYSLAAGKGRRLTNAPWRSILSEALTWLVPVRHLIPGTKFFSVISFVFHIGVIIVPLTLADHIALWNRWLGTGLPAIGPGWADFLTLFTIACILALLGFRTLMARIRIMSARSDYVLLVLVLIPFASGYCTSHPHVNPVSWEAMMLTHLLSAELLFVLVPFTKLAHIVLFFFDRISAIHWQLRPGAGEQVAEALYGEKAKV